MVTRAGSPCNLPAAAGLTGGASGCKRGPGHGHRIVGPAVMAGDHRGQHLDVAAQVGVDQQHPRTPAIHWRRHLSFWTCPIRPVREHRRQQHHAPPHLGIGQPQLARSPITLQEVELLKQALLLGDDDIRYLRMSHDVLKGQTDQVLDVWYGFVASHPQLVYYFGKKQGGQPDGDYLAAVRKRFGQWILDTASANYDQKWLDYQYEIGRRHHRTGKNVTDGAKSVDNISFRYIPALIYPITTTLTVSYTHLTLPTSDLV